MLVVKEVKFPLIVLTPIKVVEVEGKTPEPKNAGNIGDSRLGSRAGAKRASSTASSSSSGSVKFSRQGRANEFHL